MIEAKNLSKKYQAHTALHPLNLQIEKGEIYCLLGSNGAGKSTTINLFMGFTAPTSGEAFIDGILVKPNSLEIKKRVAYIPEVVNLYPTLSGLENLSYFCGLSGFRYDRTTLYQMLSEAGLQSDAHHRPVGNYSKGMRQKVGIAIALGKQAKAIFMDEPTSGLDPFASNEFSATLQQLSQKGVSILMATHDLFRAKESGHTIGIMVAGRLREEVKASSVSPLELESLYLHTIKSHLNTEITQI
jgi:ABC-2 type transport system ATP-binding protein